VWHAGESSEDLDVGDLGRGRRLDASLHAEGLERHLLEPGGREEASDFAAGKAQPHVGVLGAHPFIGVFDLVADGDSAGGADDARHLGEHCRGVFGVVQDHVGEGGVESVSRLRRATASISGDVSMASTRATWGAMPAATNPVPVPTSATVMVSSSMAAVLICSMTRSS